MFLDRFSANIQRTMDLTNAFKSFFRHNSFTQCSKIAGFLGKQGLGFLGARARAHAREKLRATRLGICTDLKRDVDKVQRQESCPGTSGAYRPHLTVH